MPILYLLILVSGSLYGAEINTVILGGSATWESAVSRRNVIEVPSLRPHRVLTLDAANNHTNIAHQHSSLDLSISFNETEPRHFRDSLNRYRLTASPELQAVDRRFARAGTGAALFGGTRNAPNSGPLVVQPQSRNALFAAGNHVRDFSLEFWLYPLNMENGEEVLLWTSSRRIPGQARGVMAAQIGGRTDIAFQRITSEVTRNRLQWSFTNFFVSPDGTSHINITLTGTTPIVPRTWSHHLIRFDSNTGMLEYLVNGRTEAIAYATSSGREGGNVYTPIIGENGSFILGRGYKGIMDEFNLHSAFIDRSSFHRYAPLGGRIETRPIDLGAGNRGVIRVDARGGRASIQSNRTINEFRENGRFRFHDDSEMNFFIRFSNNPFLWDDNDWVAFTPGLDIPRWLSGRYVQIAVEFFPSADGETSPYLEELRIVYMPNDPPLAPRNLAAMAVDGGVYLRWRSSPGQNRTGYLVFYGTESGVYFGQHSFLGPSPIDVGNRNSIFIDGLRNGTLYFFTVVAYDHRDSAGLSGRQMGDFSREVTARPLAGLLHPSPARVFE